MKQKAVEIEWRLGLTSRVFEGSESSGMTASSLRLILSLSQIVILVPNNQRQHGTFHIQKHVLPAHLEGCAALR
jgi:hypothetical protein